jgi:hypothetical protein
MWIETFMVSGALSWLASATGAVIAVLASCVSRSSISQDRRYKYATKLLPSGEAEIAASRTMSRRRIAHLWSCHWALECPVLLVLRLELTCTNPSAYARQNLKPATGK